MVDQPPPLPPPAPGGPTGHDEADPPPPPPPSAGPAGGSPANPYRGLDAFGEEHADLFFGREEERLVISANLGAAHLTVLYGPSGVGKSSLLQAGVIHDLDAEAQEVAADGYGRPGIAVTVRNWVADPVAEFDAQVRRKAARLRPGVDLDAIDTARSLSEAVPRWTAALDADLLVILDQFEEFFLYHSVRSGLGADLAATLGRTDQRANYLIAVREEGLADLDAFRHRVPGVMENRLRLGPLSEEAARDAIRNPLDVLNARIGDGGARFGVEDGLVDEVIRSAGIPDGHGGVRGVEAPFLSLVMEDVWKREVAAGSRRLRLATLEEAGGARKVFDTHVERAMGTLEESERDVAASLFDRLLTPTGSKIALNARDLAAWTSLDEHQIGHVLRRLAEADVRILRPKPTQRLDDAAGDGRPGGGGHDVDPLLPYEVFHDLLAAGIVNWAKQWELDREGGLVRKSAQAFTARVMLARYRLDVAASLGRRACRRHTVGALREVASVAGAARVVTPWMADEVVALLEDHAASDDEVVGAEAKSLLADLHEAGRSGEGKSAEEGEAPAWLLRGRQVFVTFLAGYLLVGLALVLGLVLIFPAFLFMVADADSLRPPFDRPEIAATLLGLFLAQVAAYVSAATWISRNQKAVVRYERLERTDDAPVRTTLGADARPATVGAARDGDQPGDAAGVDGPDVARGEFDALSGMVEMVGHGARTAQRNVGAALRAIFLPGFANGRWYHWFAIWPVNVVVLPLVAWGAWSVSNWWWSLVAVLLAGPLLILVYLSIVPLRSDSTSALLGIGPLLDRFGA